MDWDMFNHDQLIFFQHVLFKNVAHAMQYKTNV